VSYFTRVVLIKPSILLNNKLKIAIKVNNNIIIKSIASLLLLLVDKLIAIIRVDNSESIAFLLLLLIKDINNNVKRIAFLLLLLVNKLIAIIGVDNSESIISLLLLLINKIIAIIQVDKGISYLMLENVINILEVKALNYAINRAAVIVD
jgi:hypothetical protein